MINLDGLVELFVDIGSDLILIAAIFLGILLAFRRNFIGAVSSFVVLIVAWLIVNQPDRFGKLAENVGKLIGL